MVASARGHIFVSRDAAHTWDRYSVPTTNFDPDEGLYLSNRDPRMMVLHTNNGEVYMCSFHTLTNLVALTSCQAGKSYQGMFISFLALLWSLALLCGVQCSLALSPPPLSVQLYITHDTGERWSRVTQHVQRVQL